MSPEQAKAEVFMTALKALPRTEQDMFLEILVKDRLFREDIIDMAIASRRSLEKSQPLRSFLKKINKYKLSE